MLDKLLAAQRRRGARIERGQTCELLAGLRDRPQPWSGPPVESYDLFRVEEYTVQKFFGGDPSVRSIRSKRQFVTNSGAGFVERRFISRNSRRSIRRRTRS